MATEKDITRRSLVWFANAVESFNTLKLVNNPRGVGLEKVSGRRFIAVFWLYDLNALNANAHPELRGELRWNDSDINLTTGNQEAFHFPRCG
jgi:hypothetical protein